MNKLAKIAASLLIFGFSISPVLAEDLGCRPLPEIRSHFPNATIVELTPQQFADTVKWWASKGAAIPDRVASIAIGRASNDPDTVILLGFSADGCFVGKAQMPKDDLPTMLNGGPST